ncbi:SDR family oxidoreductase [Bacillus tianshenii]|uniref:SDR family oxidoreductase n=1 Tax=Sutcliffiella tianshenii TaxID=1463404 RepID=UPI001CD1FF3C|nr:SDR family oxidoreductase [Bacillus tianshenii]MCA1319101.1 SDR family oxidoreductase [Bacillus tianshenii]
MRILVVGANGQIGSKLVKMLKEDDRYTPVAMVRKEEQSEKFQSEGIEAVLADLEGPVGDLENAVKGNDAIIFAAGSGGSTGLDKTLLIDLDGAVKVMEAAENSNVNRFILVSALQAHNRENWNEELRPYYVAKHYADKMLEASSLDYTIVRPGGLLNEPGTGTIQLGLNLERGSIPREDVARTLLEVISAENSYRTAFDLISGEVEIEKAIKEI